MKKQNDWEKEFDKKFELGQDPSPTKLLTPSWQEWLEIKSFIADLVEQERKETLLAVLPEKCKEGGDKDAILDQDFIKGCQVGFNRCRSEIIDKAKKLGINLN